MSDQLSQRQIEFLTTHLGYVATASDGETGASSSVMPIWRKAKESSDQGMNALTSALKSSGLPLFERIADAGLHAITNGQFVALQAALMSYDASADPAKPQAAGAVRNATKAMRDFLNSEPAIGLLERNPFKVQVALQAPLTAALDEIDAQIAG